MTGTYSQPSVYFFGQGRADGTAAMKDVLGGVVIRIPISD